MYGYNACSYEDDEHHKCERQVAELNYALKMTRLQFGEMEILECTHCQERNHESWRCPYQMLIDAEDWCTSCFDRGHQHWWCPNVQETMDSYDTWENYQVQQNQHDGQMCSNGQQERDPKFEEMLVSFLTKLDARMDSQEASLGRLEQTLSNHAEKIKSLEVQISSWRNHQEEMGKEAEEEDESAPSLMEPKGTSVEFNFCHDIFDVLSNDVGETEAPEDMYNQSMESKDVYVEAPSSLEALMPWIPPSHFLAYLHQSKKDKWFSELIPSYFNLIINLFLLLVIKNMPASDKYFQDLITRKRFFETLEFG